MSQVVTEDAQVVAVEGLTAADLGGEAVVLDAHSGRYYGLNELGVRIFDMLHSPTRVGAIIETLAQEYDVEEAQLRRDVLEFLGTMEGNRLIRVNG